jgi:hypothetical protein
MSYQLALVVQSLIEREICLSMEREIIEALPLYPEERERTSARHASRYFASSAKQSAMH